VIRRANERDGAAVHARLWEAKDEIPLVAKFGAEPYREWVKTACRTNRVWVFEQRSEVLGAVVVEKSEIKYLAVAAQARNKGIGRSLVRKAKAVSPNQTLKTRAASENFRMRSLLESEGFKEYRIAPGGFVEWVYYCWSPN
jgi:ribosomal protein S18 acetylase RimI-like enzyme